MSKGDGSALMSGIEDLHPSLGKQKQHIQDRVTWSETKLKIGNKAIGEEKINPQGEILGSQGRLEGGKFLFGRLCLVCQRQPVWKESLFSNMTSLDSLGISYIFAGAILLPNRLRDHLHER